MKSIPLLVLWCIFSLVSGLSGVVSGDPVFRTYDNLLDARYGRERISFRTKWSRLIGGDDESHATVVDLTGLSGVDVDTFEEPDDGYDEDEDADQSREG